MKILRFDPNRPKAKPCQTPTLSPRALALAERLDRLIQRGDRLPDAIEMQLERKEQTA